jgi:hypothetical protein
MAQDIENTLFWTKEEFLGKVIMLKNMVNFLHDNKTISYYISEITYLPLLSSSVFQFFMTHFLEVGREAALIETNYTSLENNHFSWTW